MITTSFVLVCVCVPLVFLMWARRRMRKEEKRRTSALTLCECTAAFERAKQMNDTVDATLAKIDSRAPREELPETKEYPVVPPTEVVRDVTRDGKLTVPVLLLLVVGLVSFQLGGEMRELSLPARVNGPLPDSLPTRPSSANREWLVAGGAKLGGSIAGRDIDSRLAELRERPSLAAVSWFTTNVADEQREEVVAVLREVAMSPEWAHRNAAEMALIAWRQ